VLLPGAACACHSCNCSHLLHNAGDGLSTVCFLKQYQPERDAYKAMYLKCVNICKKEGQLYKQLFFLGSGAIFLGKCILDPSQYSVSLKSTVFKVIINYQINKLHQK